jgi:hypothetical protein
VYEPLCAGVAAELRGLFDISVRYYTPGRAASIYASGVKVDISVHEVQERTAIDTEVVPLPGRAGGYLEFPEVQLGVACKGEGRIRDRPEVDASVGILPENLDQSAPGNVAVLPEGRSRP